MKFPDLSISTLIDKRDYDLRRATAKIIEIFGESLTIASKRIIGVDRNIEWVAMERTQKTKSYVNMTGHVEIREGDTINVGGEQIVVQAHETRKYNNVFVVTVAMRVLETLNADLIQQNIKFVVEAIKTTSPEALVELLESGVNNQMELYVAPEHQKLLERVTRPRYVAGFDTHDLTKEQYDALAMSVASMNTKEL